MQNLSKQFNTQPLTKAVEYFHLNQLKRNNMTNAEKIIAELIDQHKINGEQAIELIKNLNTVSIFSF